MVALNRDWNTELAQEISDPGELEGLMKADSNQFAALIAAEREKYDK